MGYSSDSDLPTLWYSVLYELLRAYWIHRNFNLGRQR